MELQRIDNTIAIFEQVLMRYSLKSDAYCPKKGSISFYYQTLKLFSVYYI